MIQRIVIPTLAALFVLFGASAAMAANESEAQSFIQELAQKAISTVAVRNLADSDRNDHFRRLFVSAFDIPEIGKFALARHWRKLSPAQQTDFLKEFEDSQVLAWSRRFKDYTEVRLETLGAIDEGEAVWLVDSQIIRPQGPPTPVQWRIHRSEDGNLRITDIIFEKISMALTYREDYVAVLQSNGGNIDGLLAAMRTKNNGANQAQR